MDDTTKKSNSLLDFYHHPSEDTSVLDIDLLSETPLSAEVPISGVMSAVEQRDIYAGREVSLCIEGAQEVFYRGGYVTNIVLTGEPLLVGRRDVMAGHYPDIDLAMYWKQDKAISRRHLRFYRDMNGSYFVEDICNNQATFLNSFKRPLNRERVELKNGDRVFVSMSIAIRFTVR